MKKKILSILISMMFPILLLSCGNIKTEYEAAEFIELEEETWQLFNEETKNFTSNELLGNKARELYEECSKKTGLPFNKEITIRGIKGSSASSDTGSNDKGFGITSSDSNGSTIANYPMKEGDEWLFIEKGTDIVVKGTYSAGKGYGMLENAHIISPENIEKDYTNNVFNTLSEVPNGEDYITTIVFGKVSDLMTLDEFKKSTANADIDIGGYRLFENIARIDGDEEHGNGTIYFSYDDEEICDLSLGDKIAVLGSVRSVLGVENPQTQEYIYALGIIEKVHECYVFDEL